MKSVFDIYDDASLLRKVLIGEATEAEKLRGEDLLTLHPELKKQYDELCRQDGLNDLFIRYGRYSSKDAYSRFLRKVGSASVSKDKPRRMFYRWYSTAAVILILIGVFAVWKMTSVRQPASHELTILSPGTKKGQVLLPNGKTLNIGPKNINMVFGGVKVTYHQGLLSYVPVQFNLSDSTSAASQLNTFVIPRGGENTVLLADGTTVHLNAASELRFPMRFGNGQRVVELKGEAYFEVKKDAGHPFIVKTRYGEVTVLGTAFNVNAYDDRQRCEVTLVKGRVRFTTPTRECVELDPGEQALSTGNLVQKRHVDVEDYVSWTKGVYNFHNESLSNIISTFSKWYDVEVVYDSSGIASQTYTGTVRRYDAMNAFLDVFEMTGDFSYHVEGRCVYLSRRNKGKSE